MNGELAQMIWLASHGTNYLQTGASPPDDPSVFQFVRAVRFDGPRRGAGRVAAGERTGRSSGYADDARLAQPLWASTLSVSSTTLTQVDSRST